MSQPSHSDPVSHTQAPGDASPPSVPLADCVMHLVTGLKHEFRVTSIHEESKLSDLASGVTIYRILHEVDPSVFSDVTTLEEVAVGGGVEQASRVKRNLLTLIRHMNEYACNVLNGRRSGFNLTAMVNGEALSALAATGTAETTETDEQFLLLVDTFIAIVLLADMPAVREMLKKMPRNEQTVLSKCTREMMQKYGLKVLHPSARVSAMRMDPDRRSALRASRFGSPLTVDNSGGSAEGRKEFTYLAESARLMEELKAEKERSKEFESRCALAERAQQTLQAQYAEALKDLESRAGESVTLHQKTELVDTLTRKLEDLQARNNSLKRVASAQELGMATFQKKLSLKDETLKLKERENEDLLSKLAFKETELTHHIEAKEVVLRELEDVKGQLCVAKLAANANDGAAVGSPVEEVLNASFTSTGSVGRALALERDVSEIRQQRDNLQKQLYVLRRQYATTRSKEESVAAQDTLQAHVRQLERDRDTLQRQLGDALGRVEELENQIECPLGGQDDFDDVHEGESKGGRRGRVVTPTVPERTPRAGLSYSGVNAQQSQEGLPAYLQPKAVHAVLYSTLISYGYRNLVLQQHDLLLYGDSKEADASRCGEKMDMTKAVVSGSLLQQQRQMIERGLLESIVHHRQ